MMVQWIKETRSRYGAHYLKNFKLAYPVMISQLGHTLVALSDSLIMGRKGAISLASVSLANAVFSLILVVGIGISYGLTPLIAQNSSKTAADKCGELLKNSLLVNAVTGLFLLGLTLVSVQFLGAFGQSEVVVRQAKPFLVFLAYSALPLMIFLGFKQFAEGLGYTRQAMQISLAGNAYNIALGITLVFGLFGLHPMGIIGIGISTLTDRVLMAFAMGLFVLFSKRFSIYQKALKSSLFSIRIMRQLLAIGIPVALQYVFEVGAFTGAAIMIGWIGPIPLAAHQIAISLASLTYMMASGISAAATIHSGNYFGTSRFKDLHQSSTSSYHLVIFFMAGCTLLFFFLRNYLPLLYIHDAAVVAAASSLILVAGFFQLFDGLQVVGLGILRGMSDVKVPTLITFFSYWVVGLPLGYFLGFTFHFGAVGIWIGLSFGLMMASVLLLLRFRTKIGVLAIN